MRIVHRDVSPANVRGSWDGETKLIDFGLAKSEDRLAHTRTGILKGKLSYIAPENLMGAKADHRADVFGAGVMLWEMLTGTPLFDSPTDFGTLELVRVCHVPPPSSLNPNVSPDLDSILLTALARDPAARYQDAIDFHDHLQDHLGIGSPAWTTDKIAAWLRGVTGHNATRPDLAFTCAKTWVFQPEHAANTSPDTALDAARHAAGSAGARHEGRATVAFDSSPPGASVFLIRDGQRRKLGTTPLVTQLDALPGYDVSMRMPGYTTWTQSIDLRSTSRVEVIAKLVERRATGDSSGQVLVPPRAYPSGTAGEPTVAEAMPGPTPQDQPTGRGRLLLLLVVACAAATFVFGPEIWTKLFDALRTVVR
jgi:hypothetical protein